MAFISKEIYDFVVSISVELFFAFCFALAFMLLQHMKVSKKLGPKSSKKSQPEFKIVHTEASNGRAGNVVAAWRASKTQAAASDETLKVVTQAMLDAEPSIVVAELSEHFSLHANKLSDPKAAVSVLEVLARAGKVEIMDNLFQVFTHRLGIPATACMQEALMAGYAMAGEEKKVAKLMATQREAGQKVSVKGHSSVIKGFLKNSMLDPSLNQVKEMRTEGLSIPPFAVTELFRLANDSGRMAEIFDSVCDKMPVSGNVATMMLDHCLASQDITLAKKVEKCSRQAQNQMSFGIYEGLLKIYTSAADMYAIELFEEVKRSFSYVSDGLCINLISRCAEPKFVRFAEVIVTHLRLKSQMTLSAYVAVMKVYSYANMYSQACDLYEQILADGMEPDSMMYGCLMKFSAECGRTDLTRQLNSKVSGFNIHHHMALIRAAGHDKDVDMAFTILEKLIESGEHPDTLVYNAILDVCSSAGDMKRARRLIADMRQDGMVDHVSYNTLLKGYSLCGDSRGAKEVIAEMEKAGFAPNGISYNCLINCAASSGDFHAAWETIETMERKGVAIDHYTVSTMMKALKRAPTSRDAVNRVMALLDRHGIDVCSEEVLLNTALEACLKHFELKCLEHLVARIEARWATTKFAAHTYATLIRSYSLLKRVNRCRDLWKEMMEVRGLEPNNVALGCMLDALVCNGSVLEGVGLFRKWQEHVEPSTIIYSTLIKGFANMKDNKRADELWQEFRKSGLPVNTMVYNAIIDAHARVGAIDETTSLFESMEAAGCKPDDITLSMMAKGYCVTGELDKAMAVFRTLPTQTNANTVVVYNTILDGCVRHNRADLADVLLENMDVWHIHPSNFTLGIIVKLWGNRNQLDKALAAVEKFPKKYGFTPNGPVLTCLMFACLRNNALNHAFDAFKKLRAGGYPTDAKVFNALINNCTRAGNSEKAVALVEEAYGFAGGTRVIPSNEDLEEKSLEYVMKLLSRRGLEQKVWAPLIQKMKNARVRVSPRLMAATLGEQQQRSERPWRQ